MHLYCTKHFKMEEQITRGKMTLATTLDEALDIGKAATHPLNIVMLPPDSGDSRKQDSDLEVSNDEDEFEPAGVLEVEEEDETSEDDVESMAKTGTEHDDKVSIVSSFSQTDTFHIF